MTVQKKKREEKNEMKYTYCNPLAIPQIPRGKDEWYPYERGMFSHENKPETVEGPDYRSISDPTVFFWEGKWYLYPSYGMAWVSEDLCNWKHIRTEPYCPKYSPCITPWKAKFLLTSWFCPLYVGESPVGPFKEMGEFVDLNGNTFTPCDPAIFTDDDGRIYLYAYDQDEENQIHKIIGYELDQENPCQVVKGPIPIVEMDPKNKPWERHGLHGQNTYYGWVEGPHLLKHNGRYYMIYATPDTCDASYCMAVYYSDEDPLTGYVCQKKNPLTFHREGIVAGAGHGCVEHGPNGSLWAFYTIACPYLHRYERRIGMDLVAVDENGELYCPHGVTDTPQFIPGYLEDPIHSRNDAGCVSLTGGCRPVASSCLEGRDAVYATDENNLSFWLPEEEDIQKSLECDLTGEFEVSACRIFWRELGLDYARGIVPAPVQYIVEGYRGGEWFLLLDMSENDIEKNIDYQVFETKSCSKVRLKIVGHGKGLRIGVIDFSVFGKMAEKNKNDFTKKGYTDGE